MEDQIMFDEHLVEHKEVLMTLVRGILTEMNECEEMRRNPDTSGGGVQWTTRENMRVTTQHRIFILYRMLGKIGDVESADGVYRLRMPLGNVLYTVTQYGYQAEHVYE